MAAAALPFASTLARAGTPATPAKPSPLSPDSNNRNPWGPTGDKEPEGTATGMMLDAIEEGRFTQTPANIAHEAKRALVNWFGCALGAAQSDPVRRAAQTATQGRVPLYGSDRRVTPSDATFLNCLSSAVYAFDDTHVSTITHPTGPVASALLAVAHNGHKISGRRFLESLTAGIELSCSLANALIVYAPKPNFGLYLTGITGPIGAAVASAMALQLDRKATGWAIGLAATQAAGLRDTHGAMSGMVVPAFAARSGLQAAQLGLSGFTCTDDVISGKRGLLAAYAPGADWKTAFSNLGTVFELQRVAYKPYPCGVVIHPLLNTIRAAKLPAYTNAQLQSVEVRINGKTKALVDNPAPKDIFPAIVSAQHWIALALLGAPLGITGLAQGQIDAPEVAALRHKIKLVADNSLPVTDCVITLTLTGEPPKILDGRNAGSANMSLSDKALTEKYLLQGRTVLDEARVQKLLTLLLGIEQSEDVGRDIEKVFTQA
jgi:2-methylcitrate dehydratase PrpD